MARLESTNFAGMHSGAMTKLPIVFGAMRFGREGFFPRKKFGKKFT